MVRIDLAEEERKGTKCCVNNSIFVGNINPVTDKYGLSAYFREFGEIAGVKTFTVSSDSTTLNAIVSFKEFYAVQIVFENIFNHFLDGQYLKISKYKPKNKEESIPIHNQQEYYYESSNHFDEDISNNNNYSYSTKYESHDGYQTYEDCEFGQKNNFNQYAYEQPDTYTAPSHPPASLKRRLETKRTTKQAPPAERRGDQSIDSLERSAGDLKKPQDTSLETDSNSEVGFQSGLMWSTNCIFPIELMSDNLFRTFCDVTY